MRKPSVCYISNYCLQNFVYLYLVSFLLHGIGNLLKHVAALSKASLTKLSRARGVDERIGDSKSPGRRSEFATAKVYFEAYFYLFYFAFESCFLHFPRQLCLCVINSS